MWRSSDLPCRRDFELAPIGEVIGDAGGAKGVTADRSLEFRVGCTPTDHVPNIGAGERPAGKLAGPFDRRPEERVFAVIPDSGCIDINVEVSFELVMAGHFVDLAVLLAQPQPPAFLLRIVVLNLESNEGRDGVASENGPYRTLSRGNNPKVGASLHGRAFMA